MSDEELQMDVDQAQESVDSDSSKSSDEDDSQEQELLNKATKLESELSDNKYLYDTHVDLIEIYKKLGDLNSLRAAYERFSQYFPLTPTLWLSWLKSEITLASTPEQQKEVFKLFDKATEDYLSVDIWIEYAQFSIGASDLDTTRSILERGLTAAGLVCDKGSLLWDTLRELEHAHTSLHPEGSEPWKAQVLRLADVFKRQLSVPLLEIENVYLEWQEWYKSLPEGLVDPKPVEYGYKKALKLIETYRPFEESLITYESSKDLYNVYKDVYINYIKAVSDPSTIICLYERAAVQLCLIPDFWVDYCSFVFKLGEQALHVCKKALRNCPWSEELWIFKMRVLENLKRPNEDVLKCFEQGLSSISPPTGLDLWLTFIEYSNRCEGSPEKLDKLFHQAMKQQGFEQDPQCKVSRLFARILAHRGDMKGARKTWGIILGNPENKVSSTLWLEYSNLERQYGEPHMLRSLYQKALKAIKDWPQYIMDEWLMYERQFGSLDEVMKCVEKCKEVSSSLNQKYQNQQGYSKEKPKIHENFTRDTSGKGKKRQFDRTDHREVEKKKFRDEHFEERRKMVTRTPIDKNPETTVFVSNLHPKVDEEKLKILFPNAINQEIVMDRKGKSRCFGYVQFKTQEEVMVALARDREPLDGRPVFISEIKSEKTDKKPSFKYATTSENNKLFVRGLPISKTKEQLEEFFKKYRAKDVRLVLHKSGQPKGLAYVEFENAKQAQEALKLTDQMSLDDHVISVAISAPPPKKDKPSFRGYDRTEEPTRHARSRLQVPFIPRSLQVPKSGGDKKEEKEENGAGGSGPSAMKSNSDFRSLLLKK